MRNIEVLKLKEAADYIRINEKTLRAMARQGRVPCNRAGREWRFLKKALDEWLAGETAGEERAEKIGLSTAQLRLPNIGFIEKPSQSGFTDTAFTNNRDQPIHRWVPWIAGFSSEFVRKILEREAGLKERLTLLDPFAGVGTTLVEGLRYASSVIGFEINPFAALVSQVKIEALQHDSGEIVGAAKLMESVIRNRMRDSSTVSNSLPPKGFRTRDRFFSPRVERQVLLVKDFIAEQRPWLQLLFRVALGSVIVGVSNYSYEPSLGRRIAAGKQEILDADLPSILREKLVAMAEDIDSYRKEIRQAPSPRALIFCKSYLTEAVHRVAPASIDILITSPPYLNNYHYVRNTRPQLFWLDLINENTALHELETSSFGKFWQTVRSEAEVHLEFNFPELEERLAELRSTNQDKRAYGGPGWANYAATYFNDCARFCELTARLMKAGGLAVIVIGNNILQGIEFKSDAIFAHIAEERGFIVQAMHLVRTKRTGSSIINSSIRVGTGDKKARLYETAIELRRIGD